MRSAPCQYFSVCGGCTLQQRTYPEQLEQKKRQVQQLLQFDTLQVFAADEFGYRNRFEFHFFPGGVGLRDTKNQKIIPVEQCLISNKRINELLQELKKLKLAQTMAIVRASSQEDAVAFVAAKPDLEQLRQFAAKSSAQNILVSYKEEGEASVLKGDIFMREKMDEKLFCYPILGFFQNNTAVAEMMLKYVHQLLQQYPTQQGQLLDLYGGVGIFGISAADLFQKVSILESYSTAIEAAKKNISAHKILNTEAFCLDARQIGRVKLQQPLYVITDPPRSGMDESVIIKLKSLQPEVMIYISCNPQQLAKDVKKFKNYVLKSVALFDLFPQTNHFEVVVELRRVSGK